MEIECSGKGVSVFVCLLRLYFFLSKFLIICIFLGNCHLNYVFTYKYVAFTLMLLEMPFESVDKFKNS